MGKSMKIHYEWRFDLGKTSVNCGHVLLKRKT
jgi:hypothetical protein